MNRSAINVQAVPQMAVGLRPNSNESEGASSHRCAAKARLPRDPLPAKLHRSSSAFPRNQLQPVSLTSQQLRCGVVPLGFIVWRWSRPPAPRTTPPPKSLYKSKEGLQFSM